MPPHATVTHGELVLIEGNLPVNVASVLKRSGAFEGQTGLVCLPQHWPRMESLLRNLGVPMEIIGEPAVVVPVHVETRQKIASMSMDGSRVRIQGDLPKPVRKHWLGSERSNGHIGMSPWAIEDFVQTCEKDGIRLTIDPPVEKLRRLVQARRKAVEAVLAHPAGVAVPLVWGALRPYQQQAIAFGEACNGRFLIADMVGGGKTAEAIGWARFVEAKRVVVICPAIVKGNWRDEIRKFDGSHAVVLDGFADDGPRLHPDQKWVITGVDTLQDRTDKRGGRTNMGWLQYVKLWKPDFVIVDESHYIKGKDSDRSNAVRALARQVGQVVLMSGTPQSNSPMDLWAQLDALEPGWWGTWFEFGLAFCDGEEKKRWFGKGKYHKYWDMTGVSNADVLHERLRYVMIRRTKEDIGHQLPPQTRVRQMFDLLPTFREKYDALLKQYRDFITKQNAKDEDDEEEPEKREERQMFDKGARMKFVLQLRQISSHGRIDGTVDFVANLIEQGKRPVVFAYFTEVLHGLRDGLTKKGLRVGFIDGSVPRPKRDEIREAFVAKRLDVLVGQTEAAGVGINLQEASDTTVTHELTYKPIDVEQTEGRVYRSGQKMPTFHYYCLGEKTRDQKTLDVVLEKMAGNRAVLDEGVNVEGALLDAIEAEFFQESRDAALEKPTFK